MAAFRLDVITMSINWYPGHMHKARKEINQALKTIDVLIEIVDSRIPFSSQNPVIAHWRQTKPTIVILNKADLADPMVTQQWQTYLDAHDNIKSLSVSKDQGKKIQQVVALCQKLVPHKVDSFKAIHAMILGIPNVGKSTIINALAGKTIAKVGNEPAVTKRQQKITLPENIILHDTPGILWPKISNKHSGYRLAITGAIKDTAIEYEDIAFYAAEYFKTAYPELLKARFNLSELPSLTVELVELIGRQRGAMRAKKRVDLHKASEIIIHEFRHGKLGAISLETPAMAEQELALLEEEKLAEEKLTRH